MIRGKTKTRDIETLEIRIIDFHNIPHTRRLVGVDCFQDYGFNPLWLSYHRIVNNNTTFIDSQCRHLREAPPGRPFLYSFLFHSHHDC